MWLQIETLARMLTSKMKSLKEKQSQTQLISSRQMSQQPCFRDRVLSPILHETTHHSKSYSPIMSLLPTPLIFFPFIQDYPTLSPNTNFLFYFLGFVFDAPIA